MSVSLHSNQALQATTLIGRSVYVPSNSVDFKNSDTINVLLSLEQDCSSVALYLENAAGVTVFCKRIGCLEAGEVTVEFDPLEGDELNFNNDSYLLRAEVEINQQLYLVDTYIKACVESVKLSENMQEPILNLKNGKHIQLSKVRIIL